MLQAQPPIVVDVINQPAPTPDISVQTVLGIFAMAGVALLAAAVGSLLVAAAIILYKRRQDASATPHEPGHIRLQI